MSLGWRVVVVFAFAVVAFSLAPASAGEINAYEEQPNGQFGHRGVLRAADGRPIAIDGLWALQFGKGAANNGPTDTLFFTAGPNEEADGLFGSIRAA